MENELISVVIPIYKVQDYLPQCVDSIIGQTYKNLEIILVDDGSPDDCPMICENYAQQDERIIVVHKKNGGLSDARNVGLTMAKGKYITFVDSDDYVRKDFLQSLYDAVIEKDADISLCDYISVPETGGDFTFTENYTLTVYNNREALKRTYLAVKHGMEFVAWGKLYKTELFLNNSILYPKGKIHEDTYTTYLLYYYSKKIVFIDDIYYYYRIRSGSIMTTAFNLKKLVAIDATALASDFFEEKGEVQLYGLAVNLHLKTVLKMYYELSVRYDKEDKCDQKKTVLECYRNSCAKYLKKAPIYMVQKFLYKIFCIWPNIKMINMRYHFK